jgi:hypothetical protein
MLAMATSQQAVMFSLVFLFLLSSTASGAGQVRQHYNVVQTSHLEPKSICSGLKGTCKH